MMPGSAAAGQVATLLRLATTSLEAGQLGQAEQYCQLVLRLAPGHAEALHTLAVVALRVGKPAPALELLNAAMTRPGPGATLYFHRGVAAQLLGRLEAAEGDYRQALTLAPDMLAAHENLGQLLSHRGELAGAVASYRHALALQPELRFFMALAGLEQRRGDPAAAEAVCRDALRQFPDAAEVHNRLGVLLHSQGRIDEALAAYGAAVAARPDYVEALANLGASLLQQGRAEEAIGHLQRALALDAGVAVIHSNLAAASLFLGEPQAAAESCRRALALDPGLLMAQTNLGNALRDMGRLEEAEAAFRQALALQPDSVEAWSNLLLLLLYLPGRSAAEIFAEQRRYAARFEAPLQPFWRPHDNAPDPARRLRIGYVSADFRQHPVAFFIEPILARQDRTRFEIFAYYSNSHEDAVTQRLRDLCDHWLPCMGMDDDTLADRIRADGIDLLVDLSGHTAQNRLPVFARKPAPVQLTWIGYPGSTGLDAMDYRLTDAAMDPPGVADPFNSEALIRLLASCSFRPAAESPPVNPLPALATGRLTLACLNNLVKINAGVVQLWASILEQLPGARLLLGSAGHPDTQTRLLAMLAAAGIAGERVILQPRLDLAGYLELHRQIDLALDSFPYNGGTTSLHSLWMGVPVVTLAGETTASRQGSAVMHAMGLPELVAHDDAEYVAKAVALGRDLPQLDVLRQSLRARIAAAPGPDAAQLTRAFEDACIDAWQRWCRQPR